MNRRDFLMFRVQDRKKVVELSCERLYMHYLSVQAGAALALQDGGAEDEASWSGEPPTVIAQLSWPEQLQALAREVASADVIRVLDPEWLAGEAFGRGIDAVLSNFAQRGGTVEVQGVASPSH